VAVTVITVLGGMFGPAKLIARPLSNQLIIQLVLVV
jgi:hypothetical protein